MLHTVTMTGLQTDNPNRYGDVQGMDSYGHVNAFNIAKTDRTSAFRNIENIVYFCVAMYYSDWDWSTGIANAPAA
jgi:hypothetical protein